MEGWWESCERFKERLQDGLEYDINEYTKKMGFTEDTNELEVVSAVKSSFNLSQFAFESTPPNVIIALRRYVNGLCKERLIEPRQAFYSIPTTLFWDFKDSGKPFDDCAAFMAFLSVRSLIGNKEYALTNRFAITARMATRTRLNDTGELPKEIAVYLNRRRFSSLLDALYEKYHVACYSARGVRGVYVSTAKDMKELKKIADGRKKRSARQEALKELR